MIDIIRKLKATFKTQTSSRRETEALYIVIREVLKHAAGQHIIQVIRAMGISLESLIGKRPKSKVRLMLTDSHMRALGVDRDISEMCLNHKLKGAEGIYDQYSYWKERREALALWADHLIVCRG